jgi:Domain of unknown function (DUF4262)
MAPDTRVERGSAEWWARVEAHTVDIRERIAEFGFVIQPVFGLAATDVNFAYTIGLTGQGRPELVCLGPTPEGCALLLGGVAPLDTAGDEVTLPAMGDTPALRLRLRLVDAAAGGYPLAMASRVYGRARIAAKQVLWPDDEGAYPGDAGWTNDGFPQPLLPAPDQS